MAGLMNPPSYLKILEAENQTLRCKIDKLTHHLESQKQDAGHFSLLSLTEIILENSTAVLFRRLAAVDPKKRKMVYVSPNITCFGYRAKDFLEGKIMFRDIIYPEDSERTLKEISEFVDQGLKTYTQSYRIVTGSGEVRWVEDRTSIYAEPSTGLLYHQGIVIDIHEQKKALQLAAEVQKSLLPEAAPSIDGLDVAGRTVSCDEVGGDYFDYLSNKVMGNSNLSIIIGDITGHGVDAALFMTSARAFLRMRASQPGTLEDIVMAMNRHLTRDMEKTGRFMTMFYLVIECSNNRLRWVRAGHDPALLYDPSTDHFGELGGQGIALGIDEEYIYQQQENEQLLRDQVLVLTTDGIFEARNHDGEMFGKQRLKSIVRQDHSKSSKDILDRIMLEHARFTYGVDREDDLTLVIVKRR